MGKNISTCSYPKSIKMSKGSNNGTLILAVERGNEITVEYTKKEIADKINSYFGYNLIREIKLQTYNPKKKKGKNKSVLEKLSKNYEKKISEIKNEKIKNSLLQLLRSIKND